MTVAKRNFGFTIVELMVAIVIAGVVLTAAMGLTMRSTRIGQHAGDVAQFTALRAALTRTLTDDLRSARDVAYVSENGFPCHRIDTFTTWVYYCTIEGQVHRAEHNKSATSPVPEGPPFAPEGVTLEVTRAASRYDVQVEIPSPDPRQPDRVDLIEFSVTSRVR